MATSYANITPGNLELSPCRVTYKGVDLGATLDNVVVNIETTNAELKADQLGETVLDRRVSGHKITITTSLAETRLKDNWKIVFPCHRLIEQNGKKSFYFDSQVGFSAIESAGELVLHPLSKPDIDKSQDIIIYLAAAEGTAEYAMSATEQTKINCVWHMYPDFSTLPPRMALLGDASIGVVEASFEAPVAASGNVGDGTIEDVEVFSGQTKTETISLNCVTEGPSAAFFVNGSHSGALGIARSGETFISDVIGFEVTNGLVDFELNDSFTIETTAANYA